MYSMREEDSEIHRENVLEGQGLQDRERRNGEVRRKGETRKEA